MLARRAAADGVRRRDELEAKVESYRVLQDRRVQRLESVRNPKDASTLMAELDLARSVMAKEENDWVRSRRGGHRARAQGRRGADQGRGRGAGPGPRARRSRQTGARCSRPSARPPIREREASAEQIDKPLRTRYDRLRRARARDVVVPLVGGTCGACHTSVPLNRRSQIRSGAILDGCEGCGAILYPPETPGAA